MMFVHMAMCKFAYVPRDSLRHSPFTENHVTCIDFVGGPCTPIKQTTFEIDCTGQFGVKSRMVQNRPHRLVLKWKVITISIINKAKVSTLSNRKQESKFPAFVGIL